MDGNQSQGHADLASRGLNQLDAGALFVLKSKGSPSLSLSLTWLVWYRLLKLKEIWIFPNKNSNFEGLIDNRRQDTCICQNRSLWSSTSSSAKLQLAFFDISLITFNLKLGILVKFKNHLRTLEGSIHVNVRRIDPCEHGLAWRKFSLSKFVFTSWGWRP